MWSDFCQFRTRYGALEMALKTGQGRNFVKYMVYFYLAMAKSTDQERTVNSKIPGDKLCRREPKGGAGLINILSEEDCSGVFTREAMGRSRWTG